MPRVIHLAEIDVGLNEARLGFVVAQAGPGIELLDDFERALDDFERPVERSGNFFQLVGLHLFQMFGDDLLRQGILRVEGLQLEEQTFAQITSANADGVEVLDDGEGIVEIVLRKLSVLDKLFHRSSQVAVFVEVSNDAFGEFVYGLRADGHAQLPGEMVGKAAGRGEKLFEGRALGDFSFLGLAAVTAGIKVLVEKTTDIKLVEGIGFRLLGNFFGFGFEEGFVAVVVALSGFFAEFLEDGVGDHLLVDHLAEFETVQREDAHHLNEAWRENLLLRHS